MGTIRHEIRFKRNHLVKVVRLIVNDKSIRRQKFRLDYLRNVPHTMMTFKGMRNVCYVACVRNIIRLGAHEKVGTTVTPCQTTTGRFGQSAVCLPGCSFALESQCIRPSAE